jgi:hypothetical protein
VTIGDVFARAWDFWRRSVGWLILAGLVVGVIMVVVFAITYGIFLALFAGAGSAIGADSLDNSNGLLTGLGVGIGVAGLILYVAAMFLIQVLAFTFYGGMFEMVLGAYRDNREVAFADLFSGFRKFGSYAVYAVVMFGISLALGLLNVLPFIGSLIAFCVQIWIAVIWLYVLPLIADHGLSFMEAAGKSRQMVRSSGWWWTFGMMVLLGLAALIMIAIIAALAILAGKSDGTVGGVLAIVLFLVFAVLFPPYAICYVSVLYVGSGGDLVAVPAGGGMGLPPAPPAPPSYGGQTYGAAPTYSMPPGPSAGADAWKAAADPLASAPPPPPLAPTGQAPAAGFGVVPAADDATAITQAPAAAGDAPAATPEEPEPPVPPAPPAGA